MIQLRQTVTIARDRASCYRYLVDFSTCEQWDPAVHHAHKRTPGAPAAGTEFEVAAGVFGLRKTLHYRIESLVTGSAIELSARTDGLRLDERIQLRSVGAHTTEVRYTGAFAAYGPLRASAGLARPVFARMTRAALAGLKRALEIDPEPPVQSWASMVADRSVIAAAPGFTERGYLALADKSHSEFMDARVVVITGATAGIGYAAACEYARLGATLVLVGRDPDRLDLAAASIRDFAGGPTSRVACFSADLAEIAQVTAVAARIARAYPRIDVLVNNAGALFAERGLTEDGIERTVAINLVAPFVLTESLLGPLVAAAGRVVNMSSGGMYLQPLVIEDMNFAGQPFAGSKAYARAKRGLVALTRHWARRYGDTGVRFNAMHPGWVATPGVARSLPRFNRLMGRFLRASRMGADTAVWLGASTAGGRANGAFFFDRAPRPTAVLPKTQVRPSDAQRLYSWLRNETRIQTHGFG